MMMMIIKLPPLPATPATVSSAVCSELDAPALKSSQKSLKAL